MRTVLVLAAVALLALLAVPNGAVLAQDSTVVTPPDSVVAPVRSAEPGIPEGAIQPNVFYYVKGDRLLKVEETPIDEGMSVDAGSAAKIAVGFGGPKQWMVIPGETSILPITEAQPRFRMACDRSLALMLRLAAFEVKDGKRRALVDVTKQLDIFKKPVAVTVEKHAEGVWDVVPKEPLPPGEYAFSVGYGHPVCDFTIGKTVAEPEKH